MYGYIYRFYIIFRKLQIFANFANELRFANSIECKQTTVFIHQPVSHERLPPRLVRPGEIRENVSDKHSDKLSYIGTNATGELDIFLLLPHTGFENQYEAGEGKFRISWSIFTNVVYTCTVHL